jgi:hypothetical protein
MNIAILVYFTCAVTSFLTATILWRNYRRTSVRFLLWSALCFAGLTLTNFLLFADMILFPAMDLSLVRNLPTVFGLGILLYGFIWDVT